MTTKFFSAFVAMMMTVVTMSANNTKKENPASPDNVLPAVTVVASANQKTVEVFGKNHMKYEFNLDNLGRVSTKVSYVKTITNKWIPISAYSVFYGENETILSYAEYDSDRKTYSLNPQQSRYNASEYPEIIPVPNK